MREFNVILTKEQKEILLDTARTYVFMYKAYNNIVFLIEARKCINCIKDSEITKTFTMKKCA